jgi:hypothetical protein
MNTQKRYSALREAALSLHAMLPEDRDWLLQALPRQQSSALQALLAELRQLGIPPEAAQIRESDPSAATAIPLASLDCLDEGGFDALIRLLPTEPPRIAASLLGACTPARRRQALAALPPEYANKVQQCGPGGSRAPAFDRAVERSLQERLARSGGGEKPEVHWRDRLQKLLTRGGR